MTNAADEAPDETSADETGMTEDEKRRDQLLAAPDAVEEDAAARIDVTERDGVTRIDVRDDAAVRPGGPDDDA
ncbi:hypothetical protein ACWDR7_06470 [Microbacterium sp. NPDC003461]